MRITLVKPPEHSNLNFGTFSLAVLAAAVRDIADITIVDCTDSDMETAVTTILKGTPDLIGVTTMGSSSVQPSVSLVKALRRRFSKSIIVGGHGATMSPLPLLQAGADAIVCGEGEITFRELVKNGISEDMRGLALLRGSLVKTGDRPLISSLDSLREPSRDLAGPPPEGIALLETSRGCPHHCLFCEASRFYNCVWRGRSPEVVAKDIQKIVEGGAAIVHVVDDNFTANPERVLRICELIENGPLPLFFYFSARSDDLLAPGLIPALARAHFLRAGIGIETLEPELAHFVCKPISSAGHQHACSLMREAGIFSMASLITGLPGETEEMRERAVDLVVQVGVDAAQFVPFQPLPGTPLKRGEGVAEPWAVRKAAEATYQFRRHPVVAERLLKASEEKSVRGLLARSCLARWVKEGVFKLGEGDSILEELRKIDPGIHVDI